MNLEVNVLPEFWALSSPSSVEGTELQLVGSGKLCMSKQTTCKETGDVNRPAHIGRDNLHVLGQALSHD